MHNLFGLIFLILVSINSVFSQEFSTKKPPCDNCNRELSIRLESTSFLKNNEYFSDFTKGFTGIGLFIKPTIEYYLTDKTKINTGVYLLKYSGIDKFSQSIPIVTIEQKLVKNLDLVIGSIYGTLNHELKEPLYRFDRYYQDNVEYGIQLLYNSSNIKSDFWINWERFIFKNDPFQEVFETGSVTDFKILSSGKFETHIPLQMVIFHKGGQIDSSPDNEIILFNGMSGLRFDYKNAKSILSFEPSFFWYENAGTEEPEDNHRLFEPGMGMYLNLKYKNKFLSSSVGYWSADKFIAPKGEYLFMSISEKYSHVYEPNRKLLTAKLGLEHNISESIKIMLRSDGYYDINKSDFSFSYGLYFLIDESFFVTKIKTKNQ